MFEPRTSKRWTSGKDSSFSSCSINRERGISCSHHSALIKEQQQKYPKGPFRKRIELKK